MRFSVIIPCYNCEKTLEETAESVLNSGLYDFEIVLVDDGSTDGTAALCDRLCEKHGEIRCIHQQNAGVSAARNRGIEEARGDYIWFVDSDDTVMPLDTDQIEDALRKNEDCIMFGMVFSYERNDRIIMRESLSSGRYFEMTPKTMGELFPMLFRANYFSAIWNKIIRRDVLLNNDIRFDTELINYEDLHFSILLLACCENVAVLPETYYLYKNVFGLDHTVERISRINNVVAYTDKVVEPIYALDKKLRDSGNPPILKMREIVLNLYMEGAYFKFKTANGKQIKDVCAAVKSNENIRREEAGIAELSKTNRMIYHWMINGEYLKIQSFMKYRSVRGAASRVYRIMRSYLRK